MRLCVLFQCVGMIMQAQHLLDGLHVENGRRIFRLGKGGGAPRTVDIRYEGL